MKLRTSLRYLGAWWIVPAQVAVGLLFVVSGIPSSEDYPLAAQVLGYQAIVLVAPLTALAAAWAASRMRRGHYERRPWIRGHLARRLDRLGPLVAVSWVSMAVLVILASLEHNAAGAPSVKLALIALALLAGAAAFGDWVGSRLPMRAAAPVAVVLPYLGIAYPPAMQPAWLRHLVGLTDTCCAVYEVISTRVVVGTVLACAACVVLGLAFSIARVTSPRRRLVGYVTAMAGALTLLLVAVASVNDLGYASAQPRSGGLTCRYAAPQVCTWPDHVGAVDKLGPVIAEMAEIAQQTGAPMPARVVEAPSVSVEWPVTAAEFPPSAAGQALRQRLAASLAPTLDQACFRQLAASYQSSRSQAYADASDAIATWWARRLGLESSAGTEDAGRWLRAVEQRSPTQQGSSVSDLVSQVTTCHLPARLPMPQTSSSR